MDTKKQEELEYCKLTQEVALVEHAHMVRYSKLYRRLWGGEHHEVLVRNLEQDILYTEFLIVSDTYYWPL